MTRFICLTALFTLASLISACAEKLDDNSSPAYMSKYGIELLTQEPDLPFWSYVVIYEQGHMTYNDQPLTKKIGAKVIEMNSGADPDLGIFIQCSGDCRGRNIGANLVEIQRTFGCGKQTSCYARPNFAKPWWEEDGY